MPKPPRNKPFPLPKSEQTIGERIALYRKKRGFSQYKLAKTIGISQKQVTTYETGIAHLNDEMIVRFCLTLKISADKLLGLSGITAPKNAPTLRFSKRLEELEKIPEHKKKAILKILDDLIRANSTTN